MRRTSRGSVLSRGVFQEIARLRCKPDRRWRGEMRFGDVLFGRFIENPDEVGANTLVLAPDETVGDRR